MKNILLIGVGGTGSNAVDILYQKINELGQQTDSVIKAIVFDTDVGCVQTIKNATPVPMADTASVGKICDRIGMDYIREWFPCDDKAVRSQEMIRGASQWRKKSYLAFLNLMNKPQARSAFISALEDMSKDPSASCEVYVIASIAGGTGSGSFIPIALYARRYLRKHLGKNPIVNAMVALPDIYADAQTEDNRIKIYANAYAILRELNAIYLVARNFNEGERTKMKKAPVKFRIGNPNEPNVGVLFDAADPQFWTPEAAPFTQIFVLDRIPGLKSIGAHDIVLANSLYTLICTQIGVEFDSEASNHEILRSQNNGSNAIYASVSTSQMTFPVNTILDYLAHEKALKACDGEWLVLHREAEKAIQREQQASADEGKKFKLENEDYARFIVEALANDGENGDGAVTELVERGTAVYNEDGKLVPGANTAQEYFAKVEEIISKKIQEFNAELTIDAEDVEDKEDFASRFNSIKSKLRNYYIDCVTRIKKMRTGIGEAIISFDKNKFDAKNISNNTNELSLVNGLLKKGKNFLHPVSAMVQLCRLRTLLPKPLEASQIWQDIRQKDVKNIPSDLLKIDTENDGSVNANKVKSNYANLGEGRFIDLYFRAGAAYADTNKKSNYVADKAFVENDAATIAAEIYNQAGEQLKNIVFTKLADDIDLLIGKYKTFFSRFEKEKEDLVEDTKTALRKDSGLIDSILNVYSSEKDKKAINAVITKNAGPESTKSLEETDNLVGQSVYESVYKAAYATRNEEEFNDKDAAAYRSLFTNMVDAYKKFIQKSDAFKLFASYNIVEAMEAAAEGSGRTKESIFGEYFSNVQALATPSLKIDTRMDLGDLVVPSNIVVYMMSKETGRYIKKHAEELKLPIPQGEAKESAVIKSCAEAFIRQYSGNDSARVSIVDNMSNTVLYCTGEIMDITPLRIPKFDELSAENDNLYYTNYCKAIKNFKHYSTDMWNPHIGNNLFQRGCLPFMNEKKESIEDVKLVKALIFALSSDQIVYEEGLSKSRGEYYFRAKINGVKSVIRGEDNKVVNTSNIVELVNWLRNNDDIVEQWSSEFDRDIDEQKRALPVVTTTGSERQVAGLERAITNTKFMKLFNNEFFSANTKNKNTEIRLLEFAYLIKVSEEISRDCDYAERIVMTCYDVFKDIIAYRANPDNNPELYINVYKQQLEKVYVSLATCKTVASLGADCGNFLDQTIGWLESLNTFVVEPLVDEGSGVLKGKFKIDDFPTVKSIVSEIAKKAEAAKTKEAKE